MDTYLMKWEKRGEKLVKEFVFKDFGSALEFVNKVGEIAEDMDHHPDIFLHDYKKVKIETTTHDKGKITEKDYHLSERIDSLELS